MADGGYGKGPLFDGCGQMFAILGIALLIVMILVTIGEWFGIVH